MNKQILKYAFALSFICISIGYIYFLASENPALIIKILNDLAITPIIIAIALSTLAGVANAFLWYRINQLFSPLTSFYISYFAWSVSRIFRYIPGKIFGFIVRQKLQQSSLNDGIKSSLNEIILTLMVIFLLAFLYFFNQLDQLNFREISPLFLLLYLLVMFIKPFCLAIENLFERFQITIKPSALFMDPMDLLKHSSIGLPGILLHGSSFYLILKYGFSLESTSFLFVTVALYLSGILGQLALISPGGLGVREAALAFMMVSNGLSAEHALGAALVSRVILFICELINVLLAIILKISYAKS